MIKIRKTMAKEYGFDGVDIDWEHPRTDGNSKYQYESLMAYLSKTFLGFL